MSITRQEIETRETNRWMRWLGFPFIACAAFAGAAYGTGIEWFFLPALLCVLAFPVLLWMLALSSNTIELPAEASHDSAHSALDLAA